MAQLDISPTAFADPIITGVNEFTAHLPQAIFTLLFGILLVRMGMRILKFLVRFTHVPLSQQGIITSVVEIVLWLLLTVTVLKTLGFSDIITFFSSSALAIGILLAAGGSTLLSDIVAGVFLSRDIDFGVGDEVIAGENQTKGIVESLDARRTRLRDEDGVLHVIPNSIVERKEWVLVQKAEVPGVFSVAMTTAKKLSAPKRKVRQEGEPRVVRRNNQ